MNQGELFGTTLRLRPGMVYQPDFLTRDEETALLDEIEKLPLSEAKYKEYTAKRGIISYGAIYDFSSNELIRAGPCAGYLYLLREEVGAWAEVTVCRVT